MFDAVRLGDDANRCLLYTRPNRVTVCDILRLYTMMIYYDS